MRRNKPFLVVVKYLESDIAGALLLKVTKESKVSGPVSMTTRP